MHIGVLGDRDWISVDILNRTVLRYDNNYEVEFVYTACDPFAIYRYEYICNTFIDEHILRTPELVKTIFLRTCNKHVI